jgi:hypothetical protein
MKTAITQQMQFSSLLFDTLFGLILFFNLDSLLEITRGSQLIFYLFTMIILVHWWLIFRSADDAFGEEVANSATDLLFGLVYLVLLDLIILLAKTLAYDQVVILLLALLIIDLAWILVWRYVGRWETTGREKIKTMEHELNSNLKINLLMIAVFLLLFLTLSHLSLPLFIFLFILGYLIYIILTFKYKIIDLKIF